MTKFFLTLIIIFSLLNSCQNTKKSLNNMPDAAALNGTWELNYITGPRISFEGLYQNNIPTLIFNVADNKVNGNSSCNNFSGTLNANGNKIDFNDPMAMTRMMCEGSGETIFMETLKRVDSWKVVDGSTLTLKMGNVTMMTFNKK